MEEPDHGELDPAARLPRRWPRFTALRAGRGKLDFAGHGELNAAGHGELDLAGWRSPSMDEQGDRRSRDPWPTTTSVFWFASRPHETFFCLSL